MKLQQVVPQAKIPACPKRGVLLEKRLEQQTAAKFLQFCKSPKSSGPDEKNNRAVWRIVRTKADGVMGFSRKQAESGQKIFSKAADLGDSPGGVLL